MLSLVANPEVWRIVLFILIFVPAASCLTWIVFSVFSAGRLRASGENLLILVCFSSLGVTVGVLAASADSSAVAPLFPAVLSLVGGVATYLVSRQGPDGADSGDRLVIAASVTALSFTLFIGALIGAGMRHRADAYRESAAYKKYLIDVKREVEEYERSLALSGLVADPGKALDDVVAEIARREKARRQ